MGAKHTSPVRSIFMKDTSIMMERWLNWQSLTKACPMTLGYSHSRVTLSVTARVVIKKRRCAISSAQLSSTHATASCCGRSPLAMTIFAAIGRKKELWIASWQSEPNDVYLKVSRAFVELDWKADTRPLHQVHRFNSGYKSWRDSRYRQ